MVRWIRCIVVVAFATVLACHGGTKGYRFVLPEGYVGWVRVDFSVDEASPLSIEEGFRLVVIPEGGTVSTSDPILLGQFREEVYYGSGDSRTRAPDFGSRVTVENKQGRISLEAFMGSREDYERAGRALDAAGYHVTGSIGR